MLLIRPREQRIVCTHQVEQSLSISRHDLKRVSHRRFELDVLIGQYVFYRPKYESYRSPQLVAGGLGSAYDGGLG